MLGRFRRSAESKILRLEHQRVPESVLAAGSEERSAGDIVEAVENEEAILGIALGFESAATPNVDGSDAAFQERGAYHQETMALQGIFFGAHESGDARPREGEGSLDAFDKIRGAAARDVVDEAVFTVDARVKRPAAQTFTGKFVANSGRRQAALERLAIELRKTKTGGAAAYITKNSDAVSGQDGKKIG